MDITKITPKQRKIVKQKIKGKTDKEIGLVEYPNAKPESARVQVTTQLNKPHVAQYMEQTKLQALKELDVTWVMLLTKLVDKFHNGSSDNVQLAATNKLIDLIQSKDMVDTSPNQLNIPKNVDLIEAQRLLFRKSD